MGRSAQSFVELKYTNKTVQNLFFIDSFPYITKHNDLSHAIFLM